MQKLLVCIPEVQQEIDGMNVTTAMLAQRPSNQRPSGEPNDHLKQLQ